MISSEEWKIELNTRRSNLWQIIQMNGCDIGLIFASSQHPQNFRYITNFAPTMGDMWAVVYGESKYGCVLTFDWDIAQARHISGIEDWTGVFTPVPAVIEITASHSPRRIAVIGLSHLPARAYSEILNRFPEVEFVDVEDEFLLLRRKKSLLEIEILQEAVRVTDVALEHIRSRLQPGMSEHEISAEILYFFQSRGISKLAFSPLIVSGNDHPVMVRDTTDRELQFGDTVLIDIGAEFEGYQADVSRTYVVGEASEIQQQTWDFIKKAYQAVVEIVKPGTVCRDLQIAADQAFLTGGYQMVHRIGHGIGMATSFEWPSLDTETASLEPGMTIAIEPGLYIDGIGSMKLEDSLLITGEGYEALSTSPSELVILV